MRTGRFLILATLAALAAFLAVPSGPAYGAVFTVTNTNDSGAGSLRQAITDANGGGVDLINFDGTVFPSGTPATINIASALPSLTGDGDTIDAIGRGVIIDGVSRGFDCITIASSSNNTIKGLQLTDCTTGIALVGSTGDGNTIGPDNTISDSNNGISLAGATSGDGNTVIGNKIGTTPDGTAISANGGNITGVRINRPDNTVGGATAGDRNIISGNSIGMFIAGAIATGNTVIGNYIGTDAAGTAEIGNGTGMQITSSSNVIGGEGEGEGNLISGNSSRNVLMNAVGASGNTVSGNIIGPDVNGAAAMTNNIGIYFLQGANGNVIGPGNVISDNNTGVFMESPTTEHNVVKGNFIGTDLSGISSVPNTRGIDIDSARSNTIGGSSSADGNVIAFNTSDGVRIIGTDAVGNSIRRNSIHSNLSPINNESGGNLELAPPTLTFSDGYTVTGTACPFCELDIFSDSASDPRIYEGSATAGIGGDFTFVAGSALVGTNIVATQTDVNGNTSQVSGTLDIDFDNDGLSDGLDPDDDNDGIADVDDLCHFVAEDVDGFEDTDGCPDPDNDLDGICDPGQSSVSCTGSDEGKTAFFPPGHDHGDPATIDCRNIPEDFDAFKDSDGCPEPDNDNDGFPDAIDDCPGTDDLAGADGALGSPEDFNHNGISDGGESALSSDDGALTFEDYDGILDTDGCHDSPGDDFDGDSLGMGDPFGLFFRDEVEVFIGTNALSPCSATSAENDEAFDALGPDWDDSQDVDGSDVFLFAERFPTEFGVPPPIGRKPYIQRFDIYPTDASLNKIDGSDLFVLASYFPHSCP